MGTGMTNQNGNGGANTAGSQDGGNGLDSGMGNGGGNTFNFGPSNSAASVFVHPISVTVAIAATALSAMFSL